MPLSTTELKQSLPYDGCVKAIWIRPGKRVDPQSVSKVSVTVDYGLDGDHYSGNNSSGNNSTGNNSSGINSNGNNSNGTNSNNKSRNRQVTLIQYEHLEVIAALANLSEMSASLLRRNIVVSGINLLSLKECIFSIGSAHLQMTGLCHPCSRMEQNLGPGGYNAMRGHGGINATVIQDGEISVGDKVSIVKFI